MTEKEVQECSQAPTAAAPPAKRPHRWLRLAMLLASLIAISFVLAYLLQRLFTHLQIGTDGLAWIVYLSLFLVFLVTNLTILAPVPVATAIMIATATQWDPLLVALVSSLGGTFGELSGYYAGYLGKKLVIADYITWYERIRGWINKYGFWAIWLIALQPVLPFDVAGLLAGAIKMPLWKFLPSLWTGKFIRYLLLCYAGAGLIQFLPPWFRVL
ncbi:MAG: VTT domain-containing protein [Chloroflexi bacterium]|nr:VTT domain-containing protein [Chloroflexota bacterium]